MDYLTLLVYKWLWFKLFTIIFKNYLKTLPCSITTNWHFLGAQDFAKRLICSSTQARDFLKCLPQMQTS